MTPHTPITEADLHAWVDAELAADRAREVEAYLASRPDDARRVEAWRAQKEALRALFDPVLDEPLSPRLLRAAAPPRPWWSQRLVAGIAVALVSGAIGWGARGRWPDGLPVQARSAAPAGSLVQASASDSAFATRAAVAHAVFAPDQRRPVEVDAAQEDQLVAWLSRRMGTAMKPPQLQQQGYALEGGRLLPGGKGPVAQFMFRDAAGTRLTLYVSNEPGDLAQAQAPTEASATRPAEPAFRFAREGDVNVFYWIEGRFGYALSTQADRAELARVSAAVYEQLAARQAAR